MTFVSYITMCQDTFTQIFVHAAKYMYICTGTLKPVNNHLINNSLNGLCQSNNSIKPVIKFDMIFFICVHHMTADGYNTTLFKLLIKIHNAYSRSIFLSDCFQHTHLYCIVFLFFLTHTFLVFVIVFLFQGFTWYLVNSVSLILPVACTCCSNISIICLEFCGYCRFFFYSLL